MLQNAAPAIALLVIMVVMALVLQRFRRHIPGAALHGGPKLQVLSSLSLGLAVDYAIHFMARSRAIMDRHASWREALPEVFGEPARAIFRNVVVVGVGFTPLIVAPLTPYQTVGVFISMILLISGFASLVILPALITLCEKWLFKSKKSLTTVEVS